MKVKYVHPFTGFGFHRIFGEETSKPLLLDFLNALLPLAIPIKDICQLEPDRKAIYNFFCENEHGEKFIVELQIAKQNYFKERTNYYSTFPIREQGEKGAWNFNLKAVFCIGILDFKYADYESEPERSEVVHTIKLKNQHGKNFYDKLTYIYLEMPNFNKKEDELQTRLDQWLYFIKHLEDFKLIPNMFQNDLIFEQAFEKTALSRFNQTEWNSYEQSLKIYRDLKNVIDTARDEGKTEGRLERKLEGKLEVAKALKTAGIALDVIISSTGLTMAAIEKL